MILTRGQFNNGDIIEVKFDDNDHTICRVVGENSTREGIRCEVIEILAGNYCNVGDKRTFKYGTNPRRMIKSLTATTSDDECCEEEKSMGLLQELTSALKRVLNADLQTQYRAGFIGKDLELTGRGANELLVILSQVYAKELTVRANEIVEEAIRVLADWLDSHYQYSHDNTGRCDYTIKTINKILNKVDFEEIDRKLDEILVSDFTIKNNPLKLQPYELGQLENCLKYCLHRMDKKKHGYCGLDKTSIRVKDIEKLIKKLV